MILRNSSIMIMLERMRLRSGTSREQQQAAGHQYHISRSFPRMVLKKRSCSRIAAGRSNLTRLVS